MTGDDLKAIRKRLGLSLEEMAEAIGYSGNGRRQQVHAYESGRRAPIPPWIERLVKMYGRHGVPKRWD